MAVVSSVEPCLWGCPQGPVTKACCLFLRKRREYTPSQVSEVVWTHRHLSGTLAACTQAPLGRDVTVGCECSLDFMICLLFLLYVLYMVSFTDPVPRQCGRNFSRAGASALVLGDAGAAVPPGRQEAARVFADRAGTCRTWGLCLALESLQLLIANAPRGPGAG